MAIYYLPVFRVELVKDSTRKSPKKRITKTEDAVEILAFYLRGQDRENLVVLCLDVKSRVIGINTVSIGDLTHAIAHPREIFKPAILSNAYAIIIGHNHPSGNPKPSREDYLMTYNTVRAGTVMQIAVLDHIIIGDGDAFFSMADDGFIDDATGPTMTQESQTEIVVLEKIDKRLNKRKQSRARKM